MIHPAACPHCRTELRPKNVGVIALAECAHCHGLWIDTASFDKVRLHPEHYELVPPVNKARQSDKLNLHCPVCEEWMNRKRFATNLPVMIDVCRKHGAWLDAGELRQILIFIHNGGLEKERTERQRELETSMKRSIAGSDRTAREPSIFDIDVGPVDLVELVAHVAGSFFDGV